MRQAGRVGFRVSLHFNHFQGIRNFAFLRWFQKWKDALTVHQLEIVGILQVQNLRLTRTRSKDLWKSFNPRCGMIDAP